MPSRRTRVGLLIAGRVDLAAGEARIVPLDGASPGDRPLASRGIRRVLVARPLDDPMLTSVWGTALHRLDIDVTSRSELRFTIELDPPIIGDDT